MKVPLSRHIWRFSAACMVILMLGFLLSDQVMIECFPHPSTLAYLKPFKSWLIFLVAAGLGGFVFRVFFAKKQAIELPFDQQSFQFNSLRWRLLGLVILVLLPLALLILSRDLEHFREEETGAQARMADVVSMAVKNLNAFIDSTREMLSTFSHVPAVRSGDDAVCSAWMADVLEHHPEYHNFGVVALNGNNICSAVPRKQVANSADLPWFLRVHNTGTFVVGDFSIGRVTGKPSLYFASPVIGVDGKMQSIVFAAANTQSLDDFAAESSMLSNGVAILFDRTGVVIAHSVDPKRWVGRSLRESKLGQAVLNAKKGVQEIPGPDGILRLYAYQQLDEAHGLLYFVVGIPSADVYALVQSMRERSLLYFGLVVVFVLTGSWAFVTAFILRQTQRLLEVAKSLHNGDLTVRSQLRYDSGELGRLAQAMDELAESLETRTRQHLLAQEQVSQWEQHFRALIENSSDIITILDPAGIARYASPSIQRVLGYTPRELVGRRVIDFIHPEDQGAVQHVITDSLAQTGASIAIDFRFRHRAGSWRDFSGVVKNLLADANVNGIVITSRDITDWKRATVAIRESEERFRAVVETTAIPIFVSVEMKFAYLNPAALELFGATTAGQLLGRPVLTRIHPDYHVSVNQRGTQVERGQKGAAPPHEEVFLRMDGQPVPVEATASPIVFQGQPGAVVFVQDITERKRAGEALRASEVKYRELHESLRDGFVAVDLQGYFQDFNRTYLDLLGYSAEEIRRLTYRDITPEKWHGEQARIIQDQILKRGYSDVYEKEYRRKDGTVFPVELRTFLLRNPDGTPASMWAVVRDITQRKRAEEALRRSEKRFRDVLQNVSSVAIQGYAVDGTTQYWNQASERLYGYPAAEAVGRNLLDLIIPPEMQTGVKQAIEQMAQTGVAIPASELSLMRKDGSRVAVFSSHTIVQGSGGAQELFCIDIDLSDLKRAEEQIQLQSVALSSAANGIIITDRSGRIVWVNSAFTQVSGYTLADVQGQSPRILKSGKQSAEFYRDLWATITAGQVWHGELTNQRKDGTLFTEDMTITPVRATGQAITHFVGIKQDITARKQMETDLRDRNQELGEALAALRETQQQVVQQENLRSLGQMASGIAHDFNNALSPIIGFSELLLQAPAVLADKAKVTKYLQVINSAGQDAANVVRRMREFGRQRATDQDFQSVDLPKVIHQTILLTQPRWKDQAQAAGRSIRIDTDVPPVPPIVGIESELRELLTNLIFNAVDALADTGTITVSVAADGDAVRLSVRDTGGGMTEEVRRRCLEPFFTTKGKQGTGLGLSMVYGIVQRHNGTIDITSEVGRGTTVSIRLPIQSTQLETARVVSAPRLGQSLRVLVVDDQAQVCDLAAVFLTQDGHKVETAENGLAALARLQVSQFDVVLTDQAMPQMNGEQLAHAIHLNRPGLPVILMTGFGDLMKAAGQMPPHVRSILSKPFTQSTLRAALAKLFTPPSASGT